MGKFCKLCRIEAVKGSERSFHRFPDPQYQKEAWCQALNIDVKTLKNWTFVCSDHFSPECFIYRSNGQRFLKDDAVPLPYKGQLKRLGRRKKGFRKEMPGKDDVNIKTECEEQEAHLNEEIKTEKPDHWEEHDEITNQIGGQSCLVVPVKTEIATNNSSKESDLKCEEIIIEDDDQINFQNEEIPENYQFDYCSHEMDREEGKKGILFNLFKLMYPELSADGVYFCKECSFQTIFRQNLRKHFVRHRETEFRDNPDNFKHYKSYHCNLCSYVTIQKYNLSRHMIKHLPNDGTAIKKYSCNECEYSTKYRCDIFKHRVKHVPKGLRFDCPNCSFKAYDQIHLKEHMAKGHIENKRYKYECEHCPYKTDSKSALCRHTKESHSENRPFKYECKSCTFKSDSKASFNQHTKQGHREESVPPVP